MTNHYFTNFVMLIAGIQQQNSQRVLRGGSWINHAQNLRSANRNANSPDNRNHNIGMRLAGALFDAFSPKPFAKKSGLKGGSINQLYFQFGFYQQEKTKQNQGLRCVSRQLTESLPPSRLFDCEGCLQ